MRRCATQRTPRFRKRNHLLWRWPRLQSQSDLDRLLHGKVAGRPGIAMAEAKQQIHIGRPRADAVKRNQAVVRGVGVLVGEYIEVEALGSDLAGEIFQRLDLRRRQAEPAQT